MILYDYCLLPYEVDSCDGAVATASERLLYATLREFSGKEKLVTLVDSLKQSLGSHKTVWGIKLVDGRLVWEFYFYKWHPEDTNSIENVQRAMQPELRYSLCDSVYSTDYFMHSVDINEDVLEGGRQEGVNVYYQPNTSYWCDADGLVSANQYFFMSPKTDMNEIISRIRTSAFADFSSIDFSRVLWKKYLDCHSVCRAHKPQCDGIYYSRIKYSLLVQFLHAFNYPAFIVDYIESHSRELSAHLFDIGYDYRQEGNSLAFLKSGFYGFF